MIRKYIFSKSMHTLLGLSLLLGIATAQAVPVAFNLNITMIEANANVGTGVAVGDSYTGVMYFDSVDLTPDGSRARSTLPGGDSITIAGLTFDDTLNDLFYRFTFSAGAPLCIGDWSLDGCGTGEGQSIPKTNGDDLIFYDNFTGRVRDSVTDVWNGPFEFASFAYSFSAVPEPSMLLLMLSGLAGLGFAGRRHRT